MPEYPPLHIPQNNHGHQNPFYAEAWKPQIPTSSSFDPNCYTFNYNPQTQMMNNYFDAPQNENQMYYNIPPPPQQPCYTQLQTTANVESITKRVNRKETKQNRSTQHVCEWKMVSPSYCRFTSSIKLCKFLLQPHGVLCGQYFTDIDAFVNHLSNDHVSAQDGNQHVCLWDKCQRSLKEFKAKYKLINHIRVHTGERPFPCKSCHKNFARSENLKIHERVHTGKSNCNIIHFCLNL